MKIADTFSRFAARFAAWVGAEVSTLPAALLRIGLALLLRARHAETMVLVHAGGPGRVALSNHHHHYLLMVATAMRACMAGGRCRSTAGGL